MRILHVGSYNSNVGDNIALENIRRPIQKVFPDTEFISHSFRDPYPSIQYDAVIIGGGGLIEGAAPYDTLPSGYKLQRVTQVNCPIFVCAVGFNFFRAGTGIKGRGEFSLRELIDKAQIFSVRDDGSYEIARRYSDSDKIREVPDPGLITDRFNIDRSSMENGFLGVSFNKYKAVMDGRRVHWAFLAKLGLDVMPHTSKDYYYTKYQSVKDFVCSEKTFDKEHRHSTDLLDRYHDYDFSVNMRGHSQMVSFAKNIPSISIASQDKISGFCKRHGLMDYCVDTQDSNWRKRLRKYVKALKSDSAYLGNWYTIRHREYQQITESYKSFMDDLIDALSYLR